jgi:acetyl esterase/lipase
MTYLFAGFVANLPPITNVKRRIQTIRGQDGNEVKLYVHLPLNVSGDRPCVYHLHGGGIVILTAADVAYNRWRDELAAAGLAVVGVEFRNGAGS